MIRRGGVGFGPAFLFGQIISSPAEKSQRDMRHLLGQKTGLIGQVRDLVEPTAEAMGYRVVRIRLVGGSPQTLQIMAERFDGTMTVDDCAELSHAVSALLDIEDPISGEYMLEMSSPGIDRPLVREDDFDRFAGYEAKVEMADLLDGRKRFRGLLKGTQNGDVLIDMEGALARLPFDQISEAKLVMTDELMEAALKAQSPAETTGMH